MNKAGGQVSHRAIAWEAGVSKSTVSRALRNDARISAAVRERVREIAARMGYRPDPQVSKLMAHVRSMQQTRFQSLLGFLLPPEGCLNEYAQLMLRGARARAEALGYAVDEFRTGFSSAEIRSLNRVLRARGAEGILILPRLGPEPPPLGLDLTRLAAVSCALFEGDFPVHHVRPGHLENMRLVMAEVRRLGCRRPALVTWEDFDRRQNWAPRMALYHFYHDIVRGEPPPLFDWHRYSGDLTAPFLDWFARAQPDALLVVGPVLADAVLRILRRGKIRKKPPILGIGHMPPGRPGINEKPAEIGSAAVDILTSHIVRNEKGWPPVVKIMTLPGALRRARRGC